MSAPVTRVPSYQRRIGVFWWVHKRSYFLFVMRELSSIFVAWFVVYLLMFVAAVAGGQQRYDEFLDRATSPLLLVVNAVGLAFLVLHTVTWFALTPKAMVLRLGGRRVPGTAMLAAQYVALAVVSAFIYWLVVKA
ncbi:fumarate reductase subunit C [Nocardioides islandensis]|uniref:Fumarate reductase subunit C n=1 Tax=Nocardioides islandensis TaxID=433663 RepID=A0A930YJK1_9ACTN|nr:fumarate reductase subunit C [Nocardioides islandensis]MBF4765104.1 fumarate reductase subunit C [Nocardioides islandensis]